MTSPMTLAQPPVTRDRLQAAAGALTRFRIMAFITGVVLVAGCVALILKDVAHLHHMEPGTGLLWLGHGYLYLVYVICVAILGVRLKWPLPRFALVMLAGTIPTMSFVAEHIVTRAARTSADAHTGDPEPAVG